MKLCASLIVRNERSRYLEPCIGHLLEFCDEIRILDDGSTDSWIHDLRDAWGDDGHRIVILAEKDSRFFDHEGRARQDLLDFTLGGNPTHVLAIDADEFVADGRKLRETLRQDDRADVFSLCMQEVWNADEAELDIRQDGGWVEHDVSVVWRPDRLRKPLTVADRALACGRVPETVRGARTAHSGTSLLHFGWASRAEREARHGRYVVADGGQFHAGTHLDSIMWPDNRIDFSHISWPPALASYRHAILSHAGVKE